MPRSIRCVDAYLVACRVVVVDEVVPQPRRNGRAAGSHAPAAAVTGPSGSAEAIELIRLEAIIGHPHDARGPRPSSAGSLQLIGARSSPMVRAARLLAGELLRGLDDDGRRWRHTRAVAARAAQAARLFSAEDADVLMSAAWLHDIGYTPHVHRHGFHPVDGAEHVIEHLSAPAVAGLVAHHSGARFVAEARGLGHLMAPFDDPVHWTGPSADALTWADQTIGPDGQRMSLQERLREVLDRHGPDSPDARSNDRRAPALAAAVLATEARLARSGS